MGIAVALAGYATVLAVAGPRWLTSARWVDRAPRLAIAAWQALCASIVLAAMLAGLALTVPTVRVSGGLAHLLDACVMALRARYATPGGVIIGTIGGLLALAIGARFLACLTATLRQTGQLRRRQRDALTLLGRPDPALGALVIDHPTPVAYCLPGRSRRIVLSTAALAVLDDVRLAAVLAHERAHLRHRHDLVIAAAMAFDRAFPHVPAFRHARDHVTRLVELAADDAASCTADRLAVADAILTLAHHPATAAAGALAAAETATGRRVRRLLAPHRPLRRAYAALGIATMAAILAAPAAIATQPALAAADMGCCATGSAVAAPRHPGMDPADCRPACPPPRPPACAGATCPGT